MKTLTLFLLLFPRQDADEFLKRGTLKYGRGDLKGAVGEYSRAIELNPRIAEAWHNRGLARFRLELYEKAIRDYNRAIELTPNDMQIYYHRGHAYHYHRDFKKAVSDYTRAINSKIGGADAYHYRGHAYRAVGNPKRALKDHQEGLDRESRSSWGHSSIGYAEYDLGMPGRALTSFRRALDLNSSEADYLHLRIWLLLATRKGRGEADQELREYLSKRIPPREDTWYQALVSFLLRETNQDQLLKNATTPEHKCEGWFYIGSVLLLDRQTDKARKAFQSCLDTDVQEFTEYSSARGEWKRLGEKKE